MTGKSRRGFASMSPERQREIASRGGRAAHAKGAAHQWSADEARIAGRKGGIVVSRDRAHMQAIGREGGESRKAALLAARRALDLVGAASEVEVSIPLSFEGTPNGRGAARADGRTARGDREGRAADVARPAADPRPDLPHPMPAPRPEMPPVGR